MRCWESRATRSTETQTSHSSHPPPGQKLQYSRSISFFFLRRRPPRGAFAKPPVISSSMPEFPQKSRESLATNGSRQDVCRTTRRAGLRARISTIQRNPCESPRIDDQNGINQWCATRHERPVERAIVLNGPRATLRQVTSLCVGDRSLVDVRFSRSTEERRLKS